jgi:hypothetical protein
MRKQDIIFILFMAVLFLPFFVSTEAYESYISMNQSHGMVMSFIKFAILATMGEMIGLRIRSGKYYYKGFGILPRAIVWGFLGLTIKFAFVVFTGGVPVFLNYMGYADATVIIQGGLSPAKIWVAFCISAAMNLIYAPVMMTLHKITDMHIINNGGTLKGFLTPVLFRKHFVNLDWNVQWNFVFKKTIPFFWIPAHTITFLLPADFQVLFAAVLGIALGTILAVAGMKKKS